MMEVSLQDVRVRRGGRDVLTVPSLAFVAGRVTALLGPNGAGKTTLLRLVAALDRPDTGRVMVHHEPADVRRRAVSYVFQEDVFLRRSVLENLELGLWARGVSRDEARDRAVASLRLLGIDALADRRADRVSGGEARRASLARALCLDAPVLLLDEPMAGLDGSTYARLLDELPPLLARSGSTTLVVTHRRDEAFRLCDDVVVLIDGRVRRSGTKREVGADPRYVDVAEVLGYAVVTLQGRKVAIPDGALRLAAGTTSLSGIVESVLDLVNEWHVVVTCQGTRLHVHVPRADRPPVPGDSACLDAREMYELS